MVNQNWGDDHTAYIKDPNTLGVKTEKKDVGLQGHGHDERHFLGAKNRNGRERRRGRGTRIMLARGKCVRGDGNPRGKAVARVKKRPSLTSGDAQKTGARLAEENDY